MYTALKLIGWLALALVAPMAACSLYVVTDWDEDDEDDEDDEE